MVQSGLSAYQGKRVLLLQGPLGPFFRRLATDLTRFGAEVHKVNFNGGDWLFYPTGQIHAFRGRAEDWPRFFAELLDRLRIDAVFLFGDCREYHRQARRIASARGLEIGVFEEGYLRPNWITLEHAGANGHSLIPKTPAFYRNIVSHPSSQPEQDIGSSFGMAALWAMLYYLAGSLLWPLFPHYRHHRPLTLLEAWPWLRAGWRKLYYARKERSLLGRLVRQRSKRYFLVPLQVHNDAQVCVHSPYTEVREFIEDTVTSFAQHAPRDSMLVIKHHPMDRGYHDYSQLIDRLRAQFGLGERLAYIHDLHLPTLLDHAAGVVVINSTVGLSALMHGAPTITMGSAFYDIDGLTYQGGLDRFWSEAPVVSVDQALLTGFCIYLQRSKLINGNYYKRLPASGLASGVLWPAARKMPVVEREYDTAPATAPPAFQPPVPRVM